VQSQRDRRGSHADDIDVKKKQATGPMDKVILSGQAMTVLMLQQTEVTTDGSIANVKRGQCTNYL
jgi:hypothetical protein